MEYWIYQWIVEYEKPMPYKSKFAAEHQYLKSVAEGVNGNWWVYKKQPFKKTIEDPLLGSFHHYRRHGSIEGRYASPRSSRNISFQWNLQKPYIFSWLR